MPSSPVMKVVQCNEAFRIVKGKPEFHYTKSIIQWNNLFYIAKWNSRRKSVEFSQLYDATQLETVDKGPEMVSTWLINESDRCCYVKTPNLYAYCDPTILAKTIHRDVETCEILRNHPHPNIALYFGCQLTRGRVSGVCFKRYAATLAETVNPQHLNKTAFLSSERPFAEIKMRKTSGWHSKWHSTSSLAWHHPQRPHALQYYA
jgi:hypothetical protein